MAHPLNDVVDRMFKVERVPCTDACEYWKFPHLPTACQLSEVFSVRKGRPCGQFRAKVEKAILHVCPGHQSGAIPAEKLCDDERCNYGVPF